MGTLAYHRQALTIMKLTLVALTAVAAATGLSTAAHADERYDFQSPSGNVGCSLNPGGASCEIKDYTWFIPPPPDYTMGGRGNVFLLARGSAPVAGLWHSDHQFPDGAPTLDVGQSRTAGAITCVSESAAMTCTDSSTGHFFRVSRESYQVG
ncbi:hypothetical protein [Mycobacterium conspicuum]|nr:hypothetical protein [Mycobacterium conspicuum]ORV46226.1 hypothetical protein AWC00_04700 [Mycobacterium conspicuum]